MNLVPLPVQKPSFYRLQLLDETFVTVQAKSFIKAGRLYKFFSQNDEKLNLAFNKGLHVSPVYEIHSSLVLCVAKEVP